MSWPSETKSTPTRITAKLQWQWMLSPCGITLPRREHKFLRDRSTKYLLSQSNYTLIRGRNFKNGGSENKKWSSLLRVSHSIEPHREFPLVMISWLHLFIRSPLCHHQLVCCLKIVTVLWTQAMFWRLVL